jgi:hypothetical protein
MLTANETLGSKISLYLKVSPVETIKKTTAIYFCYIRKDELLLQKENIRRRRNTMIKVK